MNSKYRSAGGIVYCKGNIKIMREQSIEALLQTKRKTNKLKTDKLNV
jgi:tartrate dehydratase beta subunit/fumarate hydratase class I family protein